MRSTIEQLEFIETWFDYSEAYDLFVKVIPDYGLFVELGVFRGKSLSYIARALLTAGKGNVSMVGIDLFEKAPADVLDYYRTVIPNVPLASKSMVEYRLSFYEQCRILQENTVYAANLFIDNTIDVCFIDAHHSKDGCFNDLKSWYPKVKSGGIVGGHDYCLSSVKEAVDAFLLTFNYDHPLFILNKGEQVYFFLKP